MSYRPSVRPSVCLSVTLCIVVLKVYRAKSCTSVFLAGKFLFDPSDTLLYSMYRLATERTEKNESKNESNMSSLRQTITTRRSLLHMQQRQPAAFSSVERVWRHWLAVCATVPDP